MLNMNEVVAGVSIVKTCSIKPDKDSTESKQVNVRVKFDGATLKSVFDKAVSGAVISWQNGVGRKAFDTLKDGQLVEIQFTAPASRAAVDPLTAILALAEAAGMTPEEYVTAEAKKRINNK